MIQLNVNLLNEMIPGSAVHKTRWLTWLQQSIHLCQEKGPLFKATSLLQSSPIKCIVQNNCSPPIGNIIETRNGKSAQLLQTTHNLELLNTASSIHNMSPILAAASKLRHNEAHEWKWLNCNCKSDFLLGCEGHQYTSRCYMQSTPYP